MARKVTVSENDTFKQWQDKTNDLSDIVGEPDNLLTSNTTDLVSAINEANVLTANRGGIVKNSDGEIEANVDDNSIDISENNKIQIKNDGVQKKHLNVDVASPTGGLQQIQNEGLRVKVGEDSGITLYDGRVAIKDYGVAVKKHAKQDQGSIISYRNGGEPFILGPGEAGEVLTSGGPDANASWGSGTGTKILAHSGYIVSGSHQVSQGWGTTITVKSSITLTNPTIALAEPDSLTDTGVSGVNYYARSGLANFGPIWSCGEGLVVLRDLRMNHLQVMDGDDGQCEDQTRGMRVFNAVIDGVGGTFITFKVQSNAGSDVDSGRMGSSVSHLFTAELLSGASIQSTQEYFNASNQSVVDWAANINYSYGQIVISNNKLYENRTPGTNKSGAENTRPTHRWITKGAGSLQQGFVTYGRITWKFLGDV
jgi:hypothetical protein